jgi:hypothetical protein
MRRLALTLVTLGVLLATAGAVQAHEYHHGYGPYYYGPHHPRVPVVVRSPVVVAPPVVSPYPVYPPTYTYEYYTPAPAYGLYYHGRGLSIGIGF